MRTFTTLLVAATTTTVSAISSLSDVCTSDYVTSVLPTAAEGIPQGITIDTDSLVISSWTNYTTTGATFWPDYTINFCEITFSYSHQNQNDSISVNYWMPAPAAFENRFLATGGAAYNIKNGSGGADTGGAVSLGAVGGLTDGGFPYWGGVSFDDVILLGNGTANWPAIYNWGYQAIGEMTMIGKALTTNFYSTTTNSSTASSSKLYTYYAGCSEGGREGMSQAQRYGELYDGIVVGAPAMRYAQQQVNHLVAPVQVQSAGYYPGTCELEKILNETMSACDILDGKLDGVIARSDLCATEFNLTAIIGESYYCAASTSTSAGLGYGKKSKRQSTSATPAQNGTVTAEAIAVVQTLLKGLQSSTGKQAYFPFQPAAGFADPTVYDTTTSEGSIANTDSNGEWVTKMLEWTDVDSLDLTNITSDDLIQYMVDGMALYGSVLQTTTPDLTPFQSHGGKLLHFHGEADTSIPPANLIYYHESVRKTMYSNITFATGNEALNEWYRVYIVPGAAHCATNSLQPNAAFPNTNFAQMIEWVENDVVPTTLNATVPTGGVDAGSTTQICTWPSRPYWTDNRRWFARVMRRVLRLCCMI